MSVIPPRRGDRPEPGPARRSGLAAGGRHRELLEELERADPTLRDPEEAWEQLRLGCRAAAGADPEAFGRAMLDEAAGFVAYLACRGREALRRRLVAHDRAARDHGLTAAPPELEGRAIEAFLRLQGHLAAILEARATLERRWRLARPAAERERVGPGGPGDGRTSGEGRRRRDGRGGADGPVGDAGEAGSDGHHGLNAVDGPGGPVGVDGPDGHPLFGLLLGGDDAPPGVEDGPGGPEEGWRHDRARFGGGRFP